MTEKIGSRQQEILKLLLENRTGLSIDEIAAALSISRNAVQQHFAALERDGYIKAGDLNKTAGRPVRSYVLTDAGINRFPKQYAWFSELIILELKKQMGGSDFQDFLKKLGVSLAQGFLTQFEGKPTSERINELLNIMDQLGFQAKAVNDGDNYIIEACNCIYHDLAQKHEEICEFDKTLISMLLNKDILHSECMAKGGGVCRFKIINRGASND